MKKLLTIALFLSALMAIPASAQETINWMVNYGGGSPFSGGFSMIPGQTKTYFIQQSNYTTIGADFTIVSGGGSLSNVHNGFVDYTAPSSGATCGLNSTQTTSSVTVTLSANPKDRGVAAVTLPIAICNPAVTLNNVPSFRLGIYKNQPIELQSFIYGSVNKNVTWAITTNPGSAGSLSDNANGDTVFTATAAGRYVVTSTSVADNTQTATSVLDVTANSLPSYNVTSDGTEPVDCTRDTNLTGNYYEVGPGKTYADFNALTAAVTFGNGDQVNYPNQDTTGLSPTTLYNYFNIPTHATQTQPLFLCGVPDSTGHLPILDGTNATGNYFNTIFTGNALFFVRNPTFAYYPDQGFPGFIQISGFRVQNVNITKYYYATGAGNTTLTPWGTHPNGTNTVLTLTGTTTVGSNVITGITSTTGVAECNTLRGANLDPSAAVISYIPPTSTTITMNYNAIASGTASFTVWNGTGCGSANGTFIAGFTLENGTDENLIGNNAQDVGLGLFTEAGTPQSHMLYNVLNEGNRFFNCDHSNPSDLAVSGGTHCMYMQAFNEVTQFNNVGPLYSGAMDIIYKERGLAFVTRYNYFHDNGSAQRNADLVDQQDSSYANPAAFWGSGNQPYDTAMTANILTANWEMWQDMNLFYGNTQVANSAHGPVHYWGDHGGYDGPDREGPLQYYNNTLWQTSAGGYTAFFDNTQAYQGSNANQTPEFPVVNALNSIMWVTNNTNATTITDDRPNRVNADKLVMPNIFTNDQVNGGSGTGWPASSPGATCCMYSDWNNLPNNVTGFGASGASIPNVVALGSPPFNSTTFVSSSIAGDVLPAAISNQPVRFQFHPQSGFATARTQPVTGSTAGIVGSVDSSGPPPTPVSNAVTPNPGSVTVGLTLSMTCTTTYSDSSTLACTTPVWSVVTGTACSINSSTGVVTGVSIGSCTVQAVASSLTSPAVTVNVTAVPPSVAGYKLTRYKGVQH
jgi:hypothetical protein